MHYLRIYQLQDEGYGEVDSSPTFPLVPKDWLYEFWRSQSETSGLR
ncbi:MAG: hypothetical protein HC857_12255 [Synechococcales cyanobacterium RU_4_20]|nr:hypothetical protein [Synechococcales cyanobacterium RU_4_20]